MRGSPRHLKQVLINLLSNATKHTRAGFIKLCVILLEQTDETVSYQFQVRHRTGGEGGGLRRIHPS